MKTLILSLVLSLWISPQPVFAAEMKGGGIVEVNGTLTDNLYAIGRRVRVNVRTIDDIFLAGGSLAFQGRTGQALIAAGGRVDIDNAVIRELITAGGRISLGRVRVHDDVVAAGGELVFGPLSVMNGSVRLTGGDITLNGTINGNVVVRANTLRIGPQAAIHGHLSHRTNSLIVPESAFIRNPITVLPANPISPFAILAGSLFLMGTLLLAPALALLFRRTVAYGSEQIYQSFWSSFGRGVMAVILIPIVLSLLLVTAIGTPLALALIPLAIFGAALAWATAVFAIGSWIRARATSGQIEVSSSRWGIFGWTLLASFIVSALSLIPVAGQIFAVALVCLGAGGLYTYLRGYQTHKVDRVETEQREAA